ncbi:hypothetical protein IJV57_04875 [Candidatus Saccharibacteria bacterium]|nr:hypothetical protein [Candidatus Saccharibacteria bacterium]
MQTFIVIFVVLFAAAVIRINIQTNYDVNYEDHALRPLADKDMPKDANFIASTTRNRDFIYAIGPLGSKKYCYLEDDRFHIVLDDWTKKMSFDKFDAHIVPNPRGSRPILLNKIVTKTVSLFGLRIRKSTTTDKFILSPNVAFSEGDAYTVAVNLSYLDFTHSHFKSRLDAAEHEETPGDVVYYRVIRRTHTPSESYLDRGIFITTVCEVNSENGIEGEYDNAIFVYSEEMYKACRAGDVIFMSSDGNWHF